MSEDTYIRNGYFNGDANVCYGGQNGNESSSPGFRSYGATVISASASSSTLNDDGSDLPPADRGKSAWLFLAGCFWLEGLVWGEL